MSPQTRRCRQCVSEDLELTGFAFARVLHQLPIVHHCDVHGSALEESCARCGAAFRVVNRSSRCRRWQIERCPICGCSRGRPLSVEASEGYADFVATVGQMMRGQEDVLTPRSRTAVIRSALSVLKSPFQAVASFNEHWGCSSLMEACAKAGVRTNSMLAVLEGRTLPCSFEAIIVSLNFARAMLRKEGIGVGAFESCHHSSLESASDTLVHLLVSKVQDFGLSEDVAVHLSAGASVVQIARRGHGRSQVLAFLASLPIKARRTIAARQRKRRFDEEGVEKRRRRLQELVKRGLTRTDLSLQTSVYQWSRRHDLDWLNANIPCQIRRGATIDQQCASVRLIKSG